MEPTCTWCWLRTWRFHLNRWSRQSREVPLPPLPWTRRRAWDRCSGTKRLNTCYIQKTSRLRAKTHKRLRKQKTAHQSVRDYPWKSLRHIKGCTSSASHIDDELKNYHWGILFLPRACGLAYCMSSTLQRVGTKWWRRFSIEGVVTQNHWTSSRRMQRYQFACRMCMAWESTTKSMLRHRNRELFWEEKISSSNLFTFMELYNIGAISCQISLTNKEVDWAIKAHERRSARKDCILKWRATVRLHFEGLDELNARTVTHSQATRMGFTFCFINGEDKYSKVLWLIISHVKCMQCRFVSLRGFSCFIPFVVIPHGSSFWQCHNGVRFNNSNNNNNNLRFCSSIR